MKITMVNDCASVGYNLCVALQKQGVNCELLKFNEGDSFLDMAIRLRRVKCDLIHAHYIRSAAYSTFLSSKPYILHAHGDDIRHGLSIIKKTAIRKAKKVLVSTPDLKMQYPRFIYLPNVIGEQFKQLPNNKNNKWLYVKKEEDGEPYFLAELADKFNIKIEILENKIPYNLMPKLYYNYEGLIERRKIHSLSCCGLEALKCGLKVLTWDNKIISGFPKEHETSQVVSQLIKIYESVLEHLVKPKKH